MKSTLVVCLIAFCSLELLQGSNGDCAVPNAGCPSQIVSLLSTLCSSSTLNALPPSALVSVVNALSASPQLIKTLPPPTLTALLAAISASPAALKEITPITVLLLLAEISAVAPASFATIPPTVLFPLLKVLSDSGLLPPPGTSPKTLFAELPPFPAATAQVIDPGPSPGPLIISLPPRRTPKPVILPSGPPQSLVISIPQPYMAQPIVMPRSDAGPIVITEDLGPRPRAPQIVVPAPEPPSIYFTTHPSKYRQQQPQSYCNAIAGDKCTGQNCQNPQFEMPKVYALPPGVCPAQYFQPAKK